MTDKPRKSRQERVRYEVYGMPVDMIIESAMAPEREAAKANARARKGSAGAKQAEAPAWPSLEDLKTQGPHAKPRRR